MCLPCEKPAESWASPVKAKRRCLRPPSFLTAHDEITDMKTTILGILFALALAGCSGNGGQQVVYFDTAVVQSVQYTAARTKKDFFVQPNYALKNIGIDAVEIVDWDTPVPSKLVVWVTCRSHGQFEYTVTGSAADELKDTLRPGATVGVSCIPFQRLGYGTQISHQLIVSK